MIIDLLGARLALGIAGNWKFSSLLASKGYINLAVTVAFTIMLGMAAANAARYPRAAHDQTP